MDQMLPSPYNIPGIDTPLHQPDEDQQMLPIAMQQQRQLQQQQQQQQHSLASLGSSSLGFGESLMGTPQRTLHTYTASDATPQQLMQPQSPGKFLDLKIQNMVGRCDMKFSICLEGLLLTHRQFSTYEPEIFPGLIYQMVKPRILVLIFVSGKVVLTGAKVKEEIYEALDNIYPILKRFKKQ